MYAYIFRGDCFTAEIQYSDFYTLSAPSSSVEWSALKQYTHTKKEIQEIYFYIFVSMNTYSYTYVTITKEKEVQMRVAGLG